MEQDFEQEQTQGIENSQDNIEQNVEQKDQQADLPDIGAFEKFKFDGKEWTPKDFKSAYMMQSDYTRKTQEIAQERKYYDNLSADLKAVRENPSLVNEFMKIYPKKFHSYLDYVRSEQVKAQEPQQREVNPYDQRIQKLESTLTQWQQEQYEKQVSAYEAEIDAQLSKAHNVHKDILVNDKAKELYDSMVIQRAQLLKESGQVEKFDAKSWDRITKSVAEDFRALVGEKQSALFNKQKAASLRGKDVPQGGGIPAQAPQKPKTLKEATEAAMRFYERRG